MNKPHVKQIPGFPGYFIGSDGVVWSRFAGKGRRWPECRRICQRVGRDGYYDVSLALQSGGRKKKPVHVLVALAFFGPRPHGLVVTHLNGCKTENGVENLAYRSWQANALDKNKHGTMLVGEKNPRSRVTEAQIREMVADFKSGAATQRALATKFGIHPATVSAFCNGRGRVAEVVH